MSEVVLNSMDINDNMSIYEQILHTFHFWRATPEMIIVRTHAYLNDKRIELGSIRGVSGTKLYEYWDESGHNLFHIKGIHNIMTRMPDGSKKETKVYTGRILRK